MTGRAIWLALLAVICLLTRGGSVRAQPAPAEEPLGVAWRKHLPGLFELCVSPDGSRILAAGNDGRLRCFDAHGAELWTFAAPGVDRIVVSNDGTLCVAYPANQYLRRELYFLNAAGKKIGAFKSDEPVRSAIVSANGRFAAVATGHSVVFCGLTSNGLRRRVIQLPGEPVQLQFGPDDTVYVACRAPDSVRMIKSTGRTLWSYEPAGTTNYTLSASEDGSKVAVAGQRSSGFIELSVLAADGERKWTITRPGRGGRARLAADGDAVLLAYEQKSEHALTRQFERRLAYFSRDIEPSWTKGGAFSAPLLVSVDRQGEWVVALDTQKQVAVPRFRLYGRDGERRWIHSSRAPILIAQASAQGRHIAVYHADQALELLRVQVR